MGRTDTHITETESRQIFASALTRFSNKTVRKGDLLFREISERDYGIDGEVELFNHGEANGILEEYAKRTAIAGNPFLLFISELFYKASAYLPSFCFRSSG